jgi:hypothetical protein
MLGRIECSHLVEPGKPSKARLGIAESNQRTKVRHASDKAHDGKSNLLGLKRSFTYRYDAMMMSWKEEFVACHLPNLRTFTFDVFVSCSNQSHQPFTMRHWADSTLYT